MKNAKLIVFLGPSLPRAEAKRLAPSATFWPPARQGDVFRALDRRPRAIALIDGVFEGAPSVWHHELRAALAAGVTVFGASSMGALRAAELRDEGMIGVGQVYERYARGALDDADVALLHADAAHGFRPLTVPLVNVLETVKAAKRARVLTARSAADVVALAKRQFYQERSWHSIVAQCSERVRARLGPWLQVEGHRVDVKANDARACLLVAHELVRSHAPAAEPRPFIGSSFVRRRRLVDVHAAKLERLGASKAFDALAAQGTTRLLLAALARSAGLDVSAAERQKALRRVPRRGLADDERAFIAEVIALEAKVLMAPERFVPDGPSLWEGAMLEAVLRGLWREGRR